MDTLGMRPSVDMARVVVNVLVVIPDLRVEIKFPVPRIFQNQMDKPSVFPRC